MDLWIKEADVKNKVKERKTLKGFVKKKYRNINLIKIEQKME